MRIFCSCLGLGCLWSLLVPTLLNAATIRGRTTTEAGRPIRRVSVMIEARGLSTKTNENGEFRFDGVSPGIFRIRAEKPGWVDAKQLMAVGPQQSEEEFDVTISMELTLLSQILARVQIGSITYVFLFGLLILAFNFLMAPEPTGGVTLAGWSVILASVILAGFKLEPIAAAFLLLCGAVGGGLIQFFGNKAATKRLNREAEEDEQLAAARKRDQEKLASLVGIKGFALTDLKTCGSARIGETVMDVRAVRGFIPRETPVVVSLVDGTIPVVERLD